MNRNLAIGCLAVLIVALTLAANTFFVVDQREQAIVLRFGQVARVINANGTNDPGLKLKIPFAETVVPLDKRNQALDAGAEEVGAADQQRLRIDAIVRYRIADPLAYYRALGPDGTAAHDRLSLIVNTSLRQTLSAASLSDIVSGRRDALMAQARDTAAAKARAARLGVEIVDLRLKSADFPDPVRAAVYRRMQTARQQETAQIRAAGDLKKREIMADADKQAAIVLAAANAEAERVRGEGDAKRAAIYAQAFGRDPRFAAFYRSMQAYEAAVGQGDTVLVLTPDSPFLKSFRKEPEG